MMSKQKTSATAKCIIVSNRLPIQYDASTNTMKPSHGGLVSSIKGVKTQYPFVWVGTFSNTVTIKTIDKHLSDTTTQTSYVPVFVDDQQYDEYYNNMCNDVLWPLFHYQTSVSPYPNRFWESYFRTNETLAKAVLETARDGDMVWVHDFHLFLVPEFLKNMSSKLKVGFFLHIPFPSIEVFRQLPHSRDILRALLHADLVGFQDYAYLRNFCDALVALLGVESNFLSAHSNGRTTRLGVFPVSIDTQNFQKHSQSPQVSKIVDESKQTRNYQKLILGVDRLDYIKGVELKLIAFRELLRRHPEFRESVRLLQIAVPTREAVPEYQKLRADVEKLISEINGEFGGLNVVPVHYMFQSVSFDKLVALYRMADVFLVTSKRDGMNLVGFEFLASQPPKDPGVLVMSEFTGAISTLSHVLRTNPWNIDQTSNRIYEALVMPVKERISRHDLMMRFLQSYTSTTWAETFLKELQTSSELSINGGVKNAITRQKEIQSKLASKRPLIVMDYDGTLTPIKALPSQAVLPKNVRSLIRNIASRFEVVIVSGRDSVFLQHQFSDTGVSMAAEHGAKFFDKYTNQWQSLVHSDTSQWKKMVQTIMDDYAKRTPHSVVESKEFSIAWHFRGSPEEFAHHQARRMQLELELGLANQPVSVLSGKKIIEVRASEANKGHFASWFISKFGHEDAPILVLGDDVTDEDMFLSLANRAITVKIGRGKTHAQYFLPTQKDVYPFLRDLFFFQKKH